jgi:hypothetical protein
MSDQEPENGLPTNKRDLTNALQMRDAVVAFQKAVIHAYKENVDLNACGVGFAADDFGGRVCFTYIPGPQNNDEQILERFEGLDDENPKILKERLPQARLKFLSQFQATLLEALEGSFFQVLGVEGWAQTVPSEGERAKKIRYTQKAGITERRIISARGRGKEFTKAALVAAIQNIGKGAKQKDVAPLLGNVDSSTLRRRVKQFGFKNWADAVRRCTVLAPK